MVVNGAELKDGLLKVSMEKIIPLNQQLVQEEQIFPGLVSKNASVAIRRAFERAGFKGESAKSLRHFDFSV